MIELAIVVAVMAALSVSAVPTFRAWQSATQDRAAAEVIRNIAVRAQNQAVAGEGIFLAEDVDEVVYNTAPDAGAASPGISALTEFEPTTAPSYAYGEVSTSPLAGGQQLGLAMAALSGNCVIAVTDLRGVVEVEILGELGDGCQGWFAGCIRTGDCTAKDPGPPGPPELCPIAGSCVAGDEQVALAWNPPPDNDISHYEIYLRPGEPGTGPTCSHTSGVGTRVGGDVASTSLTVEDLTNGTRYCFWVLTVDTSGQRSDPSNGVVLTPVDQTAPTTPTLTGTALVRSARLEWTVATDDALTGYRLYRSTENSASEPADGTFQLLVEVNAQSTTHTDTGPAPQGLTPGTRYWYKVEAFDANANVSPRSNAASVVPLSGALAPPSVTATGAIKRVFLTWTPGPDPFNERTGYIVSRAGVQVATLPANATNYTDDTGATLSDGTTYNYTVVASNGLGDVSPPASVSTTTVAVPSNLIAVPGQNTITASWAPRAGAQDYELEWGSPASVTTTSTTSVTQSSLANSLTRSYRVRACANYPTAPAPQRVCTGYTSPVSATTAPGAPTLSATSGLADYIPLTWAQAANTASPDTSYELQRRTAAVGATAAGAWSTQAPDPVVGQAFAGGRPQIDPTGAFAPPTPDANHIADGVSYDYRIRARGPGGTGPWSTTVTAASMARPTAPSITNVNCPKGWRDATFWGGPTSTCSASVAAGTGPGTVTTTGTAEEELHFFGVYRTPRGSFAGPGTWTTANVRQVALVNNVSGVYFRATSCNQAGCSNTTQDHRPAVPRPTPWGGSQLVNGFWEGNDAGIRPVKTFCAYFHCQVRMTAGYTYPGFQMQILFGAYGPGATLTCSDCWAFSYNNWAGGVASVPRTGPGWLPFFIAPRTFEEPCNSDTCSLRIAVPVGTVVWASPGSWSDVFGTDGWCRPGPDVGGTGPGPVSCGYGRAVTVNP